MATPPNIQAMLAKLSQGGGDSAAPPPSPKPKSKGKKPASKSESLSSVLSKIRAK